MLTRITGELESIADGAIPELTISMPGGVAVGVLVPKYLGETLRQRIGERVTLHTMVYLEAHGQGTSFLPRVVGFVSPEDRAFFEVFTTVKGVGNKKALRAMIEPPGVVAAAIVTKDIKALTKLPEIGKRLGETILAQLSGKVESFAGDAIMGQNPAGGALIEAMPGRALGGAAGEAAAALVALGETRAEAERKVALAAGALEPDADADTIIGAVFAGRGG